MEHDAHAFALFDDDGIKYSKLRTLPPSEVHVEETCFLTIQRQSIIEDDSVGPVARVLPRRA